MVIVKVKSQLHVSFLIKLVAGVDIFKLLGLECNTYKNKFYVLIR